MKCAAFCLLTLASFALAQPSQASSHSVGECREGAEFVRNAALSRANGQTRGAFLERLHGDLDMIRGMPRASRWFARDKADEQLLIRHVERVFDSPADPKKHEEAFFGECNTGGESSSQEDSI